MPLTYGTITGRFLLPDGTNPRKLHVAIRIVADRGAVKAATESAFLSGTVRASTVNGHLTVTLPLPASVVAGGFQYRATFRPFAGDNRPPPPPITFGLTGNATWVGLANGDTGTPGEASGSSIPRTIPFTIGA